MNWTSSYHSCYSHSPAGGLLFAHTTSGGALQEVREFKVCTMRFSQEREDGGIIALLHYNAEKTL